MNTKIWIASGPIFALALLIATGALAAEKIRVYTAEKGEYVMVEKVNKTAEEWRRELTPEQFRVLRESGTEPAFTGKYHNHKGKGTYRCAGCGLDLFSSQAKYDSGTGWPSFYEPVDPENTSTEEDRSFLFMVRTEVHCARCGGHLGHVFGDGPAPTGKRYCINSEALSFAPEE